MRENDSDTEGRDGHGSRKYLGQLGSGLIDYNQKMTMAAMQIADMNV
jgi:hypothetical protein